MEILKVGDVVQLKSGGPKMTVQRIIGADKSNMGLRALDEALKIQGYKTGDIVCQWFEGNTIRDAAFRAESVIIDV
jgi:uncharacterized protein YodC (DUF2158 family)